MKTISKIALVSVAFTILSFAALEKASAASGKVNVSDIRGSTENGADDKLFKRGFMLVDGQDSGGESFKTYFNSRSNQCIRLEIMDNKVISVSPTQSPKCGKPGGAAKPAAATSGNVKVSDIVGSSENSADEKFYQRGFTLVDGKESGEDTFKTYYNSKTKQCVMVDILDNKVMSINPNPSTKCH